jgi:hypothetical protein
VSSRRFPGVELSEWRSRLIDAHPRLFPDARPYETGEGTILSCSGWPFVPDGWRRVVEEACCAMDEAIASEPTGEVVIVEIKEKFGTLRISVSALELTTAAEDAVKLAVDLAEARSGHVCENCGERGRRWRNGGWLSTLCDRHGKGRPMRRSPYADVQIMTRFVGDQPVRTARRYLVDDHRFIDVPVPEEE